MVINSISSANKNAKPLNLHRPGTRPFHSPRVKCGPEAAGGRRARQPRPRVESGRGRPRCRRAFRAGPSGRPTRSRRRLSPPRRGAVATTARPFPSCVAKMAERPLRAPRATGPPTGPPVGRTGPGQAGAGPVQPAPPAASQRGRRLSRPGPQAAPIPPALPSLAGPAATPLTGSRARRALGLRQVPEEVHGGGWVEAAAATDTQPASSGRAPHPGRAAAAGGRRAGTAGAVSHLQGESRTPPIGARRGPAAPEGCARAGQGGWGRGDAHARGPLPRPDCEPGGRRRLGPAVFPALANPGPLLLFLGGGCPISVKFR